MTAEASQGSDRDNLCTHKTLITNVTFQNHNEMFGNAKKEFFVSPSLIANVIWLQTRKLSQNVIQSGLRSSH